MKNRFIIIILKSLQFVFRFKAINKKGVLKNDAASCFKDVDTKHCEMNGFVAQRQLIPLYVPTQSLQRVYYLTVYYIVDNLLLSKSAHL